MSEWGHYENLPSRRRVEKGTQNKGLNWNSNNESSQWFSKSFTKAGGLSLSAEKLAESTQAPVKPDMVHTQDAVVPAPGRQMVEALRKSFEPSSTSNPTAHPAPSGALLVKNRAYKGSKTTSSLVPPNNDDWDFLTTLNDILRDENFMLGPNWSKPKCDQVPTAQVLERANQPQPLSPKPPRPARRADRRKSDFTKTRSMDGGEGFDYSNPPALPPLRYHNICPGPSNDCAQNVTMNNLSKSSSTNKLSSSLDSIYDRLHPAGIGDSGGRRLGPQQQNYDAPALIHHHRHNDVGGYCYPFTSGSGSNLSPSGSNPGYGGSGNLYPYAPELGRWGPVVPQMSPNYSSDLVGPYSYLERLNYGEPVSPRVSLPLGYGPKQEAYSSPWSNPHLDSSRSYGSFKGSLLGLDYEDRLLRLEGDKDSLHLQVSVLSDQIDAQTSKINDLEKCLDDKKNVLESTEDTLQRELLTRSSLETQKLELMTEISSLRLKQAALERENFDLKDRWGGGRSSVDLHYGGDPRLWEKPPLAHLIRPSSPALLAHQTNNNGGIDFSNVFGHRSRIGSNGSDTSPPKPTRPRTPPANAYRRVEQSVFGTIPRRNPSQLSAFNNGLSGDGSNGNGTSFSRGNLHAVHFQAQQNGSYISTAKQPHPISFPTQLQPVTGQQEGYASRADGGGLIFVSDPNSGPRSTSAPNLAAIEREEWERQNRSSNGKAKSPGSGGHKSRGILRILSKLRRSSSGGLEHDVAPESLAPFARGGLRSTALPRLGWTQESKTLKKPDGPVSSWDSGSVILWLDYLGLSMYSQEVKRWVKTGQQLLDASTKELEKELGIKNWLHRKKLNLALHSLKHPDEEDRAGGLDWQWVIRWLDDVGLPQYKETFGEARVDGRVLSALTPNDLILLKVTSQLHQISIQRGIQLLRIHKFEPSCLCRRGGPTAGTGMINGDHGPRGPRHVATWTNHRVMEWLRAIDLAEYAPNLRGSGVHGAVIILEPKFNAELLATLLSIPSSKTLLRRHLCLQLNELVGRHIVQEKRTLELDSHFIPISPTVKVKPTKPKVFNLRKKRLSTESTEDLLCPLDWNSFPVHTDGFIASMTSMEKLNKSSDRTDARIGDQVGNI